MRAAFPVTVHLLFFRGSRVLLARRFQTGYRDGQYSVPAGHLEGGETVLAAAVREGREETGLELDPGEIRFACVLHRREGDERIDFFLRVERWQGEPAITEPDKCDALLWAELTDLPADIIPYVRAGIACAREGVSFLEFGWPHPG